jgi:hypothetical protein
MDIQLSSIKNPSQNLNSNDGTVGKFVNENKKTIQLVALSALYVSLAYIAYKLTAPITAENSCHEILKNGLSELDGIKREEYELTNATFDKGALTDTTQTKVYLTCVAKLTEKVTNPSLKSYSETDYNLMYTSSIQNVKILEKEFQARVNFIKA